MYIIFLKINMILHKYVHFQVSAVIDISGKLLDIRAIKSAYKYYFKNRLTTFSVFSGLATAWAEILCPAYVQGSKVLSL